MGFYFRGLVMCLLLLKVIAASKLELTVTPSDISPPLTPELTLSCGLKDTSTVKKHIDGVEKVPYNVLHVFSIVVTRGDSEYVAMVTEVNPAQALADKSSLKVSGSVRGTSGKGAFLELKWSEPKVNQSGDYRCEINAMGPLGQYVKLWDVVTVKLGQVSLDEVVQSLQQCTAGLKQCTKKKQALKKERDQCTAELAQTKTYLEWVQNRIAQGWTLFNKQLYKTLPGTRTYAEAKAECQKENAQIAMPRNALESKFVYDILAGRQWVWIGLNDIKKEGTFVWEDGSSLLGSEKQWMSGQPDNAGRGEDCAHLGLSSLSQWNDARCTIKMVTVCQSDVQDV